jgi:hypothetical protein
MRCFQTYWASGLIFNFAAIFTSGSSHFTDNNFWKHLLFIRFNTRNDIFKGRGKWQCSITQNISISNVQDINVARFGVQFL